MSERDPFPSQLQVSLAYSAVLRWNEATVENAIALEDRRLAWGEPSLGVQAALDEFDPDEALPEGRIDKITNLDSRYGGLLSSIGVVLDVSDVVLMGTTTEFRRIDRAVPELLDPERFAEYLGSVGCKSVTRSETHKRLTNDVIEQIYDRIAAYDQEIRKQFIVKPPDHEAAVFTIMGHRHAYIEKFRAVRPFYDAAGLPRFIPTYGKVREWSDLCS